MLNLKSLYFVSKACVFVLFVLLVGCSDQHEIKEESINQLMPPHFGVNLSGAEFNSKKLPGKFDVDYTYPKNPEVDYFISKGMTIFRLPFRWERLQDKMYGELNTRQLENIDRLVSHITSQDTWVILDPHNFSRYYGRIIGSPDVPALAFDNFWIKLANRYKNNPKVIFGLMNEPFGMSSELWRDNANSAIAAIRSTGAENLILVPGNGYSTASTWYSDWYGTPNATVLLTIVDPIDNYAFEVHQYLDADSSGTSKQCVNVDIGAERLKAFTLWLKQHHKKGFLGEFGAADNETCNQSISNMLTYINANLDVWMGWTWWSAGPWWGSYPYSIHPEKDQDKPQMKILEKYLSNSQFKSIADRELKDN